MRNQTTILGANNNHKGAATPIALTVDGVPTLLTPVGQGPNGKFRKPSPSIAGKAWGVSLTKSQDYKESIGEEWYNQGCTNSVKALANQKIEFNPQLSMHTAIRKSLWQVVSNQPAKLYIHAYKFNDEVQGVVKYCLTNGINVQLVDMYSEKTWEFYAQANKSTHPLFQTFELPADTKNVGAITIAYEKAIKKVNDKIWAKVNAELSEISTLYFVDAKETTYERITIAKRTELREYLDSLGISMEVETFIREHYEVIAETVEKYGPAFGYNLKTRATNVQKNMYRAQVKYSAEERKYGINEVYARTVKPTATPIKPLREYHKYDGGQVELFWEEKNQQNNMDLDLSIFSVESTQKHLAESQPDYLEVIKAGQAIHWILENNLEAELSDDDTILCPTCGHAKRTNFLANDETTCDICDTTITLNTLEAFKGAR